MCAPFLGFPTTLDAIGAANEVITSKNIKLPLENTSTVSEEDRFAKGLAIQENIYGAEMRDTLKGLPAEFAGTASRLLTEECFGDFYTRKGLSIEDRELVILTILISAGLETQIKPHLIGNLKLGTSKETLCAAIIHLAPSVGFATCSNAFHILNDSVQPRRS